MPIIHRHQHRRLAALVAVPALVLALFAPQANAEDPEDSLTATVNVAVRSVTVDPGSIVFRACTIGNGPTLENTGDVLLPAGRCDSPDFTVTNGDAPATVHVRATDFEGSEGGPSWNLVDVFGPLGVDEARLLTYYDNSVSASFITNDPTCEPLWESETSGSDGCRAEPGQVTERTYANGHIRLYGPESTTNPSPSFSTTITWTALP